MKTTKNDFKRENAHLLVTDGTVYVISREPLSDGQLHETVQGVLGGSDYGTVLREVMDGERPRTGKVKYHNYEIKRTA